MINFTLFAPLLAVTQNLGLPRATPLWRISGLHREVTLQYFQKLCQLRWLAEPRSTIFGERNTVCCQNFLQLSNPSQLALDFSLRFVEVCHRRAFHLVVANSLQLQFAARLIAQTRTITHSVHHLLWRSLLNPCALAWKLCRLPEPRKRCG